MERHKIDEREAFELLRAHSRHTGRKLIDVAKALTTSHLLLTPPPDRASQNSQPHRAPPAEMQRTQPET